MKFDRIVATSVLVAWAAVALAGDERPRDCKNHYILEPPCLLDGAPAAKVRIAKIYSTQDATIQAVELEVVGDGPLFLAGRTMTSRDRHGHSQSFTLREPLYAGVARLLVLGSAWLDPMSVDTGWGPLADLAMPAGFLAIDGGVLAIEGMDEVAFGPLPVNGYQALARDGSPTTAFFGHWGTFYHETSVLTEFYHAGLDHYFMTGRADEVARLKSGAIPGWETTGKGLYVSSRSFYEGYFPVCRYLLLRASGYSHFFSGSADECNALAGGEGNVLESATAFYVGMPADGVCAATGRNLWGGSGLIGEPVYRLWNGRPDTNHRFVTDRAERDAMIARGWIPEGQGLDGVAMCAWAIVPPLP
jgi:hypothetical protein